MRAASMINIATPGLLKFQVYRLTRLKSDFEAMSDSWLMLSTHENERFSQTEKVNRLPFIFVLTSRSLRPTIAMKVTKNNIPYDHHLDKNQHDRVEQ